MKMRDKDKEITEYINNNLPESLELSEVWGNKIWFKTGKLINEKDLYIIVQKDKTEFNYYTYIHSRFREDTTHYFTKEESFFFYELIEFLEHLFIGGTNVSI